MNGKEILTELIDYLGVDQKEISNKSGVPKQAINAVLKGKYDLSQQNRTKIANAYPQVSKDFIFEGKGPVKVSANGESNTEKVYEEYDRIRVPVIPLDATASFLETIDGGFKISELDFRFETIERRPGHKYSNLTAIFRVTGNSMWPHFKNGSEWLCSWVDASNWDYLEGVHVISTDSGSLLFKRVIRRSNGTFHLKSDNPEYGELTIEKTSILAIWKVQYSTYTPAE